VNETGTPLITESETGDNFGLSFAIILQLRISEREQTSLAESAGADSGDDSRFRHKRSCSKMADMPL